MRKTILSAVMTVIFLLLIIYSSVAYEREIRSISSTLAENIAKAGKKMVAVVDFTDLQGNVTELGRFLAEEFSVAFAGNGKGFEVVDRTHLKSILAEHKLSATGIIDPQTARKLGQIAGVDALITGNITPFGDSIRLSVKILDTATAKVIGASSGDIAKIKAIEELLARGIESSQLVTSQPTTTTYTPSLGSKLSKKVGNITVAVKSIRVAKGQVMVDLDFYNHADKELTMGINQGSRPNLIDEKGNTYVYEPRGGKNWVSDVHVFTDDYLTLTPKSNNDVILKFRIPGITSFESIGSNFSLSFIFLVYNQKERLSSTYNVSFSDIKAQVPR